jgi:hypothetical protein
VRTWRDRRGRPARWPDLIDAAQVRLTRVVLAAAHLDNDPANNRLANLKCLCQRCHICRTARFIWRSVGSRTIVAGRSVICFSNVTASTRRRVSAHPLIVRSCAG